jgi:hypothetical protein
MLDCTWNDLEAQTALRRMSLKEQKQQKAVAADPKSKRKQSDSAPARFELKRATGAAG